MSSHSPSVSPQMGLSPMDDKKSKSKSSAEIRRFVCTYEGCNKSFNRRDYLERHAANPCNRYFARGDLYENHLVTKLHVKRASGAPVPTYIGPPKGNVQTQSAGLGITTGSTLQSLPSVLSQIQSHSEPSSQPSPQPQSQSPTQPQFQHTPQSQYSYSPYPMQMQPPNNSNMNYNYNYNYKPPYNNGYTTMPIQPPPQQTPPPQPYLQPPPVLTSPPELKRRRSSTSADVSYFKKPPGGMSSTELSPLQTLSSPESPNLQPATSFSWMFDDRLDTDFANARYDRVYQSYLNHYEQRASQYTSQGGFKARLPPVTISDEMGRQILDILDPINQYNLSLESFAYFIELVWSSVEAVNVFIHRPTFYCDLQTPQLLSSLAVLGMSISQDPNSVNLAKVLYMRVFDGVKTALAEKRTSPSIANIGGRDVTPTFGKEISLLQAVCILIRFESHIIGGDKIDESHSISNGKWLIERYLWALIPKITALGNHPQSYDASLSSGSSSRSSPIDRNRTIHFIYGELNRKGYRLFENVDPVLQWQEWAKYEACKRAAHFALYCDCVHTMGRGNSSYQLSIFDIDTHMPCAECLWSATCYEEFYGIVGPQRFLRNVPYLYVIKSMLRFPRLGEEEEDDSVTKNCHPWSLFTLSCVIYGLLSTARAMNGSNSSSEEVLQKLKTNGPNGSWLVDFFERGVQVRLSRGFDMWTKYFEAATGNTKNQYPFQVFDNKFDNINIIGKVHIQSNSPIFIDFILLILLNYHAAKILMCEEVKKVASIATDIFDWIEHDPSPLLTHFPSDEYGYWAGCDETRDMVSTACVFLVRATAGQRLLNRDRAENLFLGVVTYYSVITIWLYDKFKDVRNEPPFGLRTTVVDQQPTSLTEQYAISTSSTEQPLTSRGQSRETSVDDEKMIRDATNYLHGIWSQTTNTPIDNNDTAHPGTLSSVINLGSWLLRGVSIGMSQTGGQILHKLHKRLYPQDSSDEFNATYLF